ncbi:MAG TPA: T9SS type A sorting domain-containing protein, partial [Chitinophagales bacterium]|nr:T9SS type A sorting domain-containing protein [Chitinophagales bacterium]
GSTRYVDNASNTTVEEAIANGSAGGDTVTAVIDAFADAAFEVSLSPNPSLDGTFVRLNFRTPSMVTLSVFGVDGKLLQTKDYGTLDGHAMLAVETGLLAGGVYLVEVRVNGRKETLKLVKR